MIRPIYFFCVGLLVSINSLGQWTETKLPIPSEVIIYDIFFESENRGWAVGTHGHILGFNNGIWEIDTVIEGNSFNTVVFPTENEGWTITGSGKIFRYNGEKWIPNFTTTGGKGLFTLYFVNPDEGFVSGANGYLAYYNGTEWVEGNIGFNEWTLSSHFSDNKNGWLSGGAGKMFQFKDSLWSEVSITSSGAFNEMAFISPNNGYGTGWSKDILHYNGSEWSVDFTGAIDQYTDIFFLDKDHGWAGGNGYIATYLDGAWSEETLTSAGWIFDIYFTDANHGWAMGENAMLLTYDTKGTQAITFDALANRVYGADQFDLAATSSSGLPVTYTSSNKDVATISGNTVTITGAGTTVITALQAGNIDYHIAENVEQNLSIDKATLTISADKVMREEGDPNPEFTLSYSGWVNSEGENTIDVLPEIVTTADELSPPGEYEITVSNGADDNYQFAYVSGTLTVLPRVITGLNNPSILTVAAYPNPTNDKIRLQVAIGNAKGKVQILNMAGATIIERNLEASTELDFQQYSSGLYFAKVIIGNEVQILKIIKD